MHQQQWKIVRAGASDRFVDDDDVGLRGPGTIDEIDRALASFGQRRRSQLRNWSLRPLREQVFDLRSQRLAIKVPDDQQHSIVRNKHRTAERQQIVARQGVEHLFGGRNNGVRVVAEHYFRHALRREKTWLRALLNQELFRIFTRQVHFVLRES